MFNSLPIAIGIICGWSWQRRCSFWISESLFCVPPAYNLPCHLCGVECEDMVLLFDKRNYVPGSITTIIAFSDRWPVNFFFQWKKKLITLVHSVHYRAIAN